MTATAEKIRKGRKYDQVLDGARRVFLDHGFEGASVDDIARAAGVSKATLYSYFPDKRLLFMEVASLQCQSQADQAMQCLDLTAPPEQVLRQCARQFLHFILSEVGQRIFRIVVAECERFPGLGEKFYQAGPMVMRRVLTDYLKAAQARGQIREDADLEMAADQFGELCKADLWPKVMFGMKTDVSASEVDRVANAAVATFLARYGVQP